MEKNFIPCVKWIKRGIAKSKPENIQLSKDELKGLIKKAKNDILGIVENIQCSEDTSGSQTVEEDDQFGMKDYDKDCDEQDLINIGGLISLDDDEDDDDISPEADSQSDDDSDKEDDEIKPNDNLIAVGHVYGDISVLEVYVFNEDDNDLYVHHDIVLPTVPLAFEWLGCTAQGSPGNLLAMGGMSPEITVWDLDVVNSLEPVAKLGWFSSKKKYQHRNHGHRDAVLDLSWNTKLPHILASGSVDRSVLLWDLDKKRAVTKFNQFEEKVQTLEWHPSEENILMAGACDSKIRMIDGRVEEVLMTVQVDGEVERVTWHPINQFYALAGTSNGILCAIDCRNGEIIWQVKAHDKEVTGVGIHPEKANSIVTCSTDQTVKVWSLTPTKAVFKYSKHLNLGDLHCLQICPENPNIVCVGGSKKSSNFYVFNLLTDKHEDKSENMELEPITQSVDIKSEHNT